MQATTATVAPAQIEQILSPPAARRDDARRHEQHTLRYVRAMLLAVILLQRVMAPGGFALLALLVPAVLGLMLARGYVRVEPLRGAGYLLAVGACLAAASVTSVLGWHGARLTSLLLLVVVYTPFAVTLSRPSKSLARRSLDFFTGTMSVVAVVAVAEWLLQVLGWTHQDFLAQLLPSNLLFQDFNTNYPVVYGSHIVKSNAFVFAEPSILSQYLGLAVVAQLAMGGRRQRVVICMLGMLPTVAGTGVVVLAAGLAALALTRGTRFLSAVAVAAGAVAALVLVSPAGQIFSTRATETSSQGSSGSLRFVAPYTELWSQTLTADPVTVLLGAGPGTADTAAAHMFAMTGLPYLAITMPKAVAEYGIIAGILLMIFVAVATLHRVPSWEVGAAAFVMYVALQGSLLQPMVIYPCLLLASLHSPGLRQRVAARPLLPRRRQPVLPTQGDAGMGTTSGTAPLT